jgi:hypothetical protein
MEAVEANLGAEQPLEGDPGKWEEVITNLMSLLSLPNLLTLRTPLTLLTQLTLLK